MTVKLVRKRALRLGYPSAGANNIKKEKRARARKQIYMGCYLWHLCKRRGWVVKVDVRNIAGGKTIKKTRNRKVDAAVLEFVVNFYFQNNSSEMAS